MKQNSSISDLIPVNPPGLLLDPAFKAILEPLIITHPHHVRHIVVKSPFTPIESELELYRKALTTIQQKRLEFFTKIHSHHQPKKIAT